MKYLDCATCTHEGYASAPYVCPNCGSRAPWLDD